MRRRIVLLTMALLFVSIFEAGAQRTYLEWTEKDIVQVFENFNAAWQKAVGRGLMPSGVVKPAIRTFNETPEKNCRGLAIGFGYDKAMVFCSSFLAHDEAERIFLLNHEVAHEILQHNAQLDTVRGKPEYAANRIRVECEANVFVAKIVSADFVLRIIKNWTFDEQNSLYRFYGPAYKRSIEVLEGKKKDCS